MADQDTKAKVQPGAEGSSGAKGEESLPSSVNEILQARMKLEDQQRQLDQMIKDKFQRNVTVLFTDIKGSTAFFETYGDVEGRVMVQRHNELLFPCITGHGGKVVKTIGDAIMAMFEDPVQGVLSAMDMQKTLEEHNLSQDQKHKRIGVRMGLNYGPAVVEENDVFGDAVNLAARVESKADAGQVLISEELYKQVRKSDEIICRFFGETEAKGKTEPVKLYRVIWSEEQLVAEEGFKKTGTRRASDKRGKVIKGRVIELHVSREADKMKVSVFERARGEEKTVQQYDTQKLNDAVIREACGEIVNLLNRANKRGKITKEILKQLQAVGQRLFDHLLTPEAKEKIGHSEAEDLLIRMDDQLVHIPWELLFDGTQFLCQRYSMGRIVATRQRVAEAASRHIAKPLKMLILADPRGDLPSSRTEGQAIRDLLDPEHELISANLKASEIDSNFAKNKLRDYDVIHYAGHTDYDTQNPEKSGWLLSDGKLSSAEIRAMAGKKPMPAFVFANSCASGQTDTWQIKADYEREIFGLANAFLVSGVQHYIGTFWDILDEPGLEFAQAFYREVMAGRSIGEAVRKARLHLIDKYGEETIVWASYMLYGDPTFSYLAEVAEAEEAAGEAKTEVPTPPPGAYPVYMAPGQPVVMRGGETVAFGQKPGMSTGMKALLALIVIAVLGIAGLLAYQSGVLGGQGAAEYLAAGNTALENGDLATAISQYQQAVQARQGSPAEKAEAFVKLGRIYSGQGNSAQAVQNYQAAVEADGGNVEAAMNLGSKLLSLGNAAQAQTAFQTALSASPGDAMATRLLAEAVNLQKMAADKSYQANLNKTVDELVARYKQGQVAGAARTEDEWTSKPLTLTFIDFAAKGRAAQMEGEDDFIQLAVNDALRTTGRMEVVEREKIDKIISELNLSSTELASEETRLKLGRLFSARLIATGAILRYANETQVSLRLIETETTQVKVAVTPKPLSAAAKPAQIAEAITKELIAKVRKAYPLRGIVAAVEKDGSVVLNLGSKAGLTSGTKLNLLDEQVLQVAGKSLTKRNPVGVLEVTGVEDELAYAKVVSGAARKDMKVEEVVQ
jgi:class 3 adenylate cyclase/CHAT domain-containing protein